MTDTAFLDNSEKLETLDASHTLESAKALADQIKDAWIQSQNLNLSPLSINNIVVSGMGGSALGAHVVRSVFKDTLPVPLTIVNHYNLPHFVNEHSLVIASSYSGSTEETIASLKAAIERKAQIVVMATGGELIQIANQHQLPTLKLTITHNPSGQPRMAIGYMVTSLLGILAKAEIINVSEHEIESAISLVSARVPELTGPTDINPAKKLAYELYDKIVFLVSADHLTGAFHVLNNQINENAKQLTIELTLPELNHHYMEALSFPKYISSQGIFLFADSTLYHPRNRRRVELTREVVEKAGFLSATISLSAGDRLTQAFESIQMGMFTNLYLAFLNGINPAPIPNVDYFKSQLK